MMRGTFVLGLLVGCRAAAPDTPGTLSNTPATAPATASDDSDERDAPQEPNTLGESIKQLWAPGQGGCDVPELVPFRNAGIAHEVYVESCTGGDHGEHHSEELVLVPVGLTIMDDNLPRQPLKTWTEARHFHTDVMLSTVLAGPSGTDAVVILETHSLWFDNDDGVTWTPSSATVSVWVFDNAWKQVASTGAKEIDVDASEDGKTITLSFPSDRKMQNRTPERWRWDGKRVRVRSSPPDR